MIIWLASYPKSGNTWVRAMLTSLIYSQNGIFNFDDIKEIPQFPNKTFFKTFTNSFDDIHEIKKYWILAQDKINLDNKVKFFKTHHINCKIENYAFTNKQNTLATIYIVRDPRNVITSVANHYSKNINEAKKFILNPSCVIGKKEIFTELIGSWKNHYISWTKHNDNLLLIKYENLLNNIELEIERIINFTKKYIKFEVNDKKIKNILESTTFENLKKIEKSGQFNENAINKKDNSKINFFNLGSKNKWQNLLDENIRKELEKEFEKELTELKYL